MLKKLGKSITIVNAIAFIIVIFVGGISIFLTKNILHNAYKIETLSKDIIEVDSMHSDAYRLVLSMHHFLIEQDELYSSEMIQLASALNERIENYKSDELMEYASEENEEIQFLDRMLDNVKGLKDISDLMEAYSRTGSYDREKLIELEEYAYEIESISDKINKIHLMKIKKWTDESLVNMWIIFFIYLIFISIGGLSIYAGHRILLRKVVTPIKELASATVEFAEGALDTRVYTDSQTEIGQLYQSFNQMADKIQENDEFLRGFNEALEKKVRERTDELQKANEKLQRTQDALIRTEKIAAIGQIAAGVTHEIKNPLNSLSINAQMLLKDLSEKFGQNSSIRESATLIRYEINRINNILEEFVKFAKFPEPKFFDNSLNQVINEVADLISQSAKDSGIAIRRSLQEDIPTFKFDARQFKEVLINLSQNAIKAMHDGGVLKISTARENGRAVVSVSDTGEGIPANNLDKVFTPFFSTKEGGLGLGLSIVQRIVESHGGKISCTSNIGEGTVFKVSLPFERG